MSIDDKDARAAAAARAALDPRTEPSALAEIAYDFPELRSAVAQNPSVDRTLLHWLVGLNDPDVNAALTSRATSRPSMIAPAEMSVNSARLDETPAVAPQSPPTSTTAPVVRANHRRSISLIAGFAGFLLLCGIGYWATAELLDLRPAPPQVTLPSVPASSAPPPTALPTPTGEPSDEPVSARPRATAQASTLQPVNAIEVGRVPYEMAVDTAGKVAYVTNNSDNTVSVIDLTTDEVTATIPVGKEPRNVALHEAPGSLYVTNFIDESVAVIDVATKKTTSSIPLDSWPYALKLDEAANAAYVLVGEDARHPVINLATRDVFDFLEPAVYEVAVDEKAGLLCLVSSTPGSKSHTLTVLDTTTQRVNHTVDVAEADRIVVDETTHTAYILHPSTKGRSPRLSVVDISTGAVMDTITLEDERLADIAVDPATQSVYLLTATGITVLDTTTNELTDTVVFDHAGTTLTVAKSTHTLYITEPSKDRVLVVESR